MKSDASDFFWQPVFPMMSNNVWGGLSLELIESRFLYWRSGGARPPPPPHPPGPPPTECSPPCRRPAEPPCRWYHHVRTWFRWRHTWWEVSPVPAAAAIPLSGEVSPLSLGCRIVHFSCQIKITNRSFAGINRYILLWVCYSLLWLFLWLLHFVIVKGVTGLSNWPLL